MKMPEPITEPTITQSPAAGPSTRGSLGRPGILSIGSAISSRIDRRPFAGDGGQSARVHYFALSPAASASRVALSSESDAASICSTSAGSCAARSFASPSVIAWYTPGRGQLA